MRMRTPKVLVIGLALAVGLSGCGLAAAGENPPSRAASASPSAPGHSTAPTTHKPVAKPVKKKPAKVKAKPKSKAKPIANRGGPANSWQKTGGKGVALTFDDGPDPNQTPKLLDLLKKRHVKATFCLVGQNVAAHPGLVKRIAAEGHTLCNHTWNHSLTLGKKSPAKIKADLQRTNDAIRKAVPGAKIKYMRAPGGNFTPAFVDAASKLGMKSIYWQVDPRDWDHPAGESGHAHKAKVAAAIKKHTHKGSIVLSHDYQQPDTIAVYRDLIPWLQKRFTLIALPN